jgi:hypothetical protein
LKRQIHTERKKENKKYRFVVTEQARNDNFIEKERKENKRYRFVVTEQARNDFTEKERKKVRKKERKKEKEKV